MDEVYVGLYNNSLVMYDILSLIRNAYGYSRFWKSGQKCKADMLDHVKAMNYYK